MTPSTLRRILGSTVAVLLTVGGATLVTEPWSPSAPPERSPMVAGPVVAENELEAHALAASTEFLDTYNEGGRVVRPDQGGDTVSEGQAYGMLVALGAGDRRQFDEIWDWTAAHLRRPDGLLAWRWKDGAVADDESASDADVLAAWALLMAADRFGAPEYRADGAALASAILEHETVEAGGQRVLVAGPWAQRQAPHFVVPGYFAPSVFTSLAEETGDDTWNELAVSSRAVTDELIDSGGGLIPDWARVDADGRVTVHGNPGSGSSTGSFSLDAARSYAWLAVSCDDADRELAAPASDFFHREAEWGIGRSYDLSGSRTAEDQHAVMWVAAAGASSADEAGSSDEFLDAAADLDERYPSYYGSAWVALGRQLLTTDWLDPC